MNNSKINFISVVRDFDLYSQFFTNNEFVNKYNLIDFDNNKENLGIPQRYNDFLNSYNYSDASWFIFCHEDFYLKEDICDLLNTLDENNIYGPTGAYISDNFTVESNKKSFSIPFRICKGQIIQRNKKGENTQVIGTKQEIPSLVDTVDCQCLIIHSSLIQKYNLRFDENLTFDLYSEAFSIEAKEKYQINTFAIQVNCEHWSEGNIGERYYKGINYLNNKYPNSLYAGTCSLIGGKMVELIHLLSLPPVHKRIMLILKNEGWLGIINRIQNKFSRLPKH